MPTFDELVGNYIARSQQTQTNLPNPDDLYVAAAGQDNNAGSRTDDEVVRDLQTLDYGELSRKYGHAEAQRLASAFSAQQQRYSQDRTAYRDTSEVIHDSSAAAAKGLTNTVGGLASLALTPFGNAGTHAAEATEDVAGWIDEFISPGMKGRRRAAVGRRAAYDIDSQQEYEQDIERGEGPFMAGLRKVGRDVMNSGSATLEDGASTGEVISEGLGSLVAGGPVIRGVGTAGKGAVMLLQKGGVLRTAAQFRRARTVAGAAAAPLGIAAMESGGTYSQTVSEIMGMSNEELMENSPEFRDLVVRERMSPDEAKREIADGAGLVAAAQTAPAAALLGSLVGRFASNPLKPTAVTTAARNTLGETIEEAGQGAASQLATNAAISPHDPDRSLTDGVGDQVAMGAIGGLGSGALTSGPGALGTKVAQGAKKATQFTFAQADKAGAALSARRDRFDEEARKASPVSREAVGEAMGVAVANMSENMEAIVTEIGESDLSDEEKTSAFQTLNDLDNIANFLPSEIEEQAPEAVKSLLGAATNRFEAIQILDSFLDEEGELTDEQVYAASKVLRYSRELADIAARTTDTGLENMPEDSLALQAGALLQNAIQMTNANKDTLQQSVEKAKGVLELYQAQRTSEPLQEAEIGTPEGYSKVNVAVAFAMNDPLKADPESIRTILEHSTSGKLELTPDQRKTLEAASRLLEAERKRVEAVNEQNLDIMDVVSADALTDRKHSPKLKGPALSGHLQRIAGAYRRNDLEAATSYLEDLMLFAQHMQNKLAAFNDHYAQGGGGENTGIHFDALDRESRRFINTSKMTNAKPAYVQPTKENSVQLAQRVAMEAKIIGETANDLAAVFDDLGVEPVDLVSLAQELQGDVAQVVQRETTARRTENARRQREAQKQKQEQKAAKAEETQESQLEPEKVEEAPTGQQEVKPEAVSETDETSEAEVREESVGGATETETVTEPDREESDKEFEQLQERLAAVEAEQAAQASPEPAKSVSQDVPPQTQENREELVEAPEESTENQEITEPAEPTIASAYPDIIAPERNRFLKAYKLKQDRESILADVADPLNLTAILLSEIDADQAAGYGAVLAEGERMKERLNRRVRDYLVAPVTQKSGETNLSRILGDGKLLGYARGKALNLVDITENGSKYNDQLVETAIVAAIQWLITADRYKARRSSRNLATIFNTTERNYELTLGSQGQAVQDMFETGLTLVEATNSLRDMITRYWGLAPNRNAPEGDIVGIPEALAKELLTIMVQGGMLQMSEPLVDVMGENPFQKDDKNLGPKRLVLTPSSDFPDAVLANPDAIEKVVIKKNQQRSGWVGAPPPQGEGVQTQLSNRNVKLTKEQKDHKRYREHVPYRLNQSMWNLYNALGEENVLRLWAAGEIEKGRMNKAHYATLKGRNATFRSQFKSVQRVYAQLKEFGRTNTTDTADVPMYYEYGFDSRSRPLMQGDNNPQRSKLMRAMMLPTRATVDLSDPAGQMHTNFMMAIGQHIGVGIEKFTPDVIVQKTQKLLDGKFAEVLTGLESWLQTEGEISEELVDQIKDAIKDGSDPVVVQSLIEYAKFRRATPEELKSFTTDLYIEADGKTNGPINAMSLFSIGEFTAEELENLERGGNFIEDRKAYHEQHAEDPRDLYETTADKAATYIRSLMNKLTGSTKAQGERVRWLLDQFSSGDFTVNEEGNIEIDRGLLKNPLTITLYGSSSGGIAGNLTSEISRGIYERMSAAMAKMEANPKLTQAEAMFPDSLDPELDMSRFKITIRDLSRNQANTVKGELILSQENNVKLPDPDNFAEFELKGGAAFNISSNLQHFVVNPMTQAIQETTGASANYVLNMVRKFTQVHGIYLAAEMRRRVNEYINAKKAAGEWNNDDTLTRAELEKIYGELKAMAPTYRLRGQELMIAESGRTDLVDTAFSTNLSRGKGKEKLSTPGSISGFRDPGVRGMPGFVISAGDALMMQVFTELMRGGLRSLDVFDGLNVPIDAMQSMSEKINEAVLQTWQENPVTGLKESFAKFTQYVAANKDDIQLSEADLIALNRALNDTDPSMGEPIQQAQLESFFGTGDKLLGKMELKLQARRNALARVNRSVDQMAAIGSPYTTGGGISLSGMDSAQKTEALNKIYHEELEKLAAKREQVELDSAGLDVDAVVLTPADVRKVATRLNLPNAQKQLLGRMLQGVAEKGYRIVQGTARQVNDQLAQWGVAAPPSPVDRDVHGFTLPGERVVALIGGTGETLVHEIIHASTFEQVQAYYDESRQKELSKDQLDAIDRIVQLGRQFLDLDVSNESASAQRAYRDAVATVERRLEANDEAGALNEFMAWALANQDLVNLLKKTKATPLARIAQRVVAALKSLIFGKGKSSKVSSDMLSNLRFNTEIVAAKPVALSETLAQTTLLHSTEYGNDESLAQLERAFTQKVVTNLDDRFRELPAKDRKGRVDDEIQDMLADSDEVISSVEYAFPMNAQQITSFQLLYTAMRGLNVLDSNALLRVGQMFDHVLQTGNRDMFKKSDNPLDDADNYQASNKWAVLTGRWGNTETDEFGRSNLIPLFLALSAVHPDMKAALKTVSLPPKERNLEGTVDARLENWAVSAMEYLDRALSGENGSEADVAAVMDAIQDRVISVAEERRSAMGLLVERAGGMTDNLNKVAVDGVQKGSEWLNSKAVVVRDSSDNRFVQTAAKSARALAGLANQKIGNELAEGFTSELNRKGKTPAFVRSLVNDLIGRTENNAPIYDLIKRVRTWVQQRRQEFREHLPVAIAEQFSRKLTETESANLFQGLAKTDFAVLHDRFTFKQMLSLLENPQSIRTEISKLEAELARMQPDARTQQILLDKSKQLAEFMNTGVHGTTLLRNAEAISAMLDLKPKKYQEAGGQAQVIDQLVSMYALDGLSVKTKETLGNLAASEAAGMQYVIAYLEGQRKEEVRRATGMGRFNHYKGYIPSEASKEGTLIVALDSEATDLVKKSYVRVGTYEGSSLDRGAEPRSYFYSPVSARATYQQGILQTVQQTAGGVDLSNGQTHGRTTAGMIDDRVMVGRIWKSRGNERAKEALLPVFSSSGEITAYERTVDPAQLDRFEMGKDLATNMGVWAGRQAEEEEGAEVNRMLLGRLREMYDADISSTPEKEAEYVDLFDSKFLQRNPVTADVMRSLPQHTLDDIVAVFGDRFMVRRDMLDDAMGYRDASVRNFWDGQSNGSPKVLKTAQEILRATFGNDAYKYAVKAEDLTKNVVTDLRVLIVVKSVLVPAANLTWNVLQLATRGVPLNSVRRGFPRKVAEVNEYLKTRERLIELEAQKRAAGANVLAVGKLEAEIQVLQDRQKNLSIWPLVEAGEFTSISDGMLSKDDLALSQGRLSEYIEKLTDRLPQEVKTAARYGLIARDTALFKGLQRAIEYGDFLGKAVLYDDLTQRQGKSQDEALAAVTEEFVNYDRLPGRLRGYVEQMGLLWFWHFKLRSTKVAVSMLRNNPVHALITMNMPFPDLFGPVGSPITDNAIAVIADGRADYSIGPGMGLRAPGLNPWWNLVN